MSKTTLVILAAFGLLLAGVLVTTRGKPERGITRISFAHVDPETVTRVVTSGKNAVELEKAGERWRVKNGKRADAAAVERLLETISQVASSDVVTRNAERFPELGVDGENGTPVRVFAGEDEVASFTVGKTARGGSHVLVGDAVYAVKGVDGGLFSRPESAWIEKKLFGIKAEDVIRVEIRRKDAAAYALVKKDEQWALEDPSLLPDGFRFDENAARTLAQAAVNVRAKDVLDGDPGVETTGLDESADSLSLIETGGRTLSLRLGDAGEGGAVYAKAEGWDEVVTLQESTARQLLKAAVELRDLGLMDFDPDEVSRLELKEGKRRLVFANDEGTWRVESATEDVPDGFVLSEPKVRGRLGALKAIRGLALAQAPERTGLGKPSASATVVLRDGRSATLDFGNETTHEEREALFARGNADENVYLVAKPTRDALLRGLDSFRQSEEPPGLGKLDPASLSNLPPEVRQALEKKIEEERRKQKLLESLEAGSRTTP
jgi:hypothetical protein